MLRLIQLVQLSELRLALDHLPLLNDCSITSLCQGAFEGSAPSLDCVWISLSGTGYPQWWPHSVL